jgi:hypothetical protein
MGVEERSSAGLWAHAAMDERLIARINGKTRDLPFRGVFLDIPFPFQ